MQGNHRAIPGAQQDPSFWIACCGSREDTGVYWDLSLAVLDFSVLRLLESPEHKYYKSA